MICSRCLYRASAPALRTPSLLSRAFSSSASHFSSASATSTGVVTPFSTPLSPAPNNASLGAHLKPKPKAVAIPVSSCPAGTRMEGLNYIKGRDDPIALPEDEYPEWLWKCLEAKVKEGDGDSAEGDMYAKSKKLRRKAAKQQRKLEAARLAAGDTSALEPKIPLTQQSIDLPANEEGTVAGALEADTKREELREAMRRERRAKIKEANFLKGM